MCKLRILYLVCRKQIRTQSGAVRRAKTALNDFYQLLLGFIIVCIYLYKKEH